MSDKDFIEFEVWFYSSDHRLKYTCDHPAYLSAREAWEAKHSYTDELVEALRKAISLADDYHRLIHDAVGYGKYKPCGEVEALKSIASKLDADQ